MNIFLFSFEKKEEEEEGKTMSRPVLDRVQTCKRKRRRIIMKYFLRIDRRANAIIKYHKKVQTTQLIAAVA